MQGGGESKLPLFAHHTVGAAGICLTERSDGELLVLAIREAHGPTAQLEGFWKLPGGAVDPREDISDAAIREVMEETGVKAEFVSLVAFRETHGALHGVTDLYCVCHLAAPPGGDGNPQVPVRPPSTSLRHLRPPLPAFSPCHPVSRRWTHTR